MNLYKLANKRERPKADEVDRAVASVRSAIGRLARLIRSTDPKVVIKVARSLREIGAFAAGPLASTLASTPDPRDRMCMLILVHEICSISDLKVFEVVKRLAQKDPNPVVAQQARIVLSSLIDRQFVAAAEKGYAEVRGTGSTGAGRPDPAQARESTASPNTAQ